MINPGDVWSLQHALGVYTPDTMARLVGQLAGQGMAGQQSGGQQQAHQQHERMLQEQEQQHDLMRVNQGVRATNALEDAALRRRPTRFRQDMGFQNQLRGFLRTPPPPMDLRPGYGFPSMTVPNSALLKALMGDR